VIELVDVIAPMVVAGNVIPARPRPRARQRPDRGTVVENKVTNPQSDGYVKIKVISSLVSSTKTWRIIRARG
jgi:hypothetical protein